MQVAGCRLALPYPALQWHQCDSECIFVTLEIHLTTFFSEIFCFGDFFCDGTDKQTDIGTDKLFSENIILDVMYADLFQHSSWTQGSDWASGTLTVWF